MKGIVRTCVSSRAYLIARIDLKGGEETEVFLAINRTIRAEVITSALRFGRNFMSHFIGYSSLKDLLDSHADKDAPIYLARWGSPPLMPNGVKHESLILISDLKDGIGRYCLLTEDAAEKLVGSGFEFDAFKRYIKETYGLFAEEAAISLPSMNFMLISGGYGAVLASDYFGQSNLDAQAFPIEIDDRAKSRYEAIKPLLNDAARTTEAVKNRAKELGIGASTLYAWINRYNPRIGAASLSGSRHRRVPQRATKGAKKNNRKGSKEPAEGPPARSYWLRVDSPGNWIADKLAKFQVVGIQDKQKRLAERAQPGDMVITYIKGRGFADLRLVTLGGVIPLNDAVQYTDGIFPFALRTEPIAVLPYDKLVPAELIPHYAKGPAIQFCNPLQLIPSGNGLCIEKVMRAQASEPRPIILP